MSELFLLTAHILLLINALYSTKEYIVFSDLPTFLWCENVVAIDYFSFFSEVVVKWPRGIHYLVVPWESFYVFRSYLF